MNTKNLIPISVAAVLILGVVSASAQSVVRETTVTQPATTTTTTVEPIEAAGTVTEYTTDAMVIRAREADAPVRYSFAKTVEYVDEDGRPVTREVVKSGLPVTVRYVKDGDRMLVSRVIVHRATGAVTTEKSTTTTTTTEGHHKKD